MFANPAGHVDLPMVSEVIPGPYLSFQRLRWTQYNYLRFEEYIGIFRQNFSPYERKNLCRRD